MSALGAVRGFNESRHNREKCPMHARYDSHAQVGPVVPGWCQSGRALMARALPEVSAGQHIQEWHQRNDREDRPGQLSPRADIAAGQQVDPDQHHRDRVEEAD